VGLLEPLSFAASPFPITIGPEQAVAHRGWREARERVLAAARAGPSLVLVLGPAGTGKTLLLQDAARALRAEGIDVLLNLRGDVPADAPTEKAAGGTRRRVVLIDEADRLNEAMLDRLAHLGECTIVLAGTADPGENCRDSSAAMTVVRLSALAPDEVGPFLAARLARAGLDPELLSGAAVARLAERSGGIPRVLNILAGAALFFARAEGAPRVEAGHVDEAAALRDGDARIGAAEPPAMPVSAPRQEAAPERIPAPPAAPAAALAGPRRPRRHAAALCAAAGIAAACAWLAFGHGERARHPALAIAAAVTPDHPRQIAAAVPPVPQAEPAAPVVPTAHPPTPGPPPVPNAAIAPGSPAPLSPAAPLPLRPSAPDAVAAVPAPPPAREPGAQLAGPPLPGPPLPGPPLPGPPLPGPPLPGPPLPGPPLPGPPLPGRDALPTGAPPRVLLRYARGSAEAAGQAASLAAALREAGFAVDGPAAVQRRDDRPGARYFFAEDREAAALVLGAAGLSGKAALGDAARLAAPPRPGTVELVVPPKQVEVGGRREPSTPGRS